ncbi:MAG: cytidylate kinase [Legionella sp.]|nr:MAG: cytidylate kinase [Legionella sp.]
MTPPVITLDGPSGTGKGTLCHQLAALLGWNVLDSGAIYRAFAVSVLQDTDHHPHTKEQLMAWAHALPLRFVMGEDDVQHVYLQDQDISNLIRAEEVGQEASRLAALPEVRAALLERQRAFAQWPGLVTDGRDMGTVVFPRAHLKIYLYATAEERAMRRFLQLQSKGLESSLDGIVKELAIRDARDMARSHAPLMPAEDAIQIDTTGLTVVQVLKSILQLAAERGLYHVQS